MNNILTAHETKTSNQKLSFLVSLVVRDESLRQDIENAVGSMVRGFNPAQAEKISLLRPEAISESNLQDYTILLGQVINYFKILGEQKEIQLKLSVRHRDLIRHGAGLNLGELMADVGERDLNVDQLRTLIYSSLFIQLTLNLDAFPIDSSDRIAAIYCDKVFQPGGKAALWKLENLFAHKAEANQSIPRILEKIHNAGSKNRHEGLGALYFVDIRQSWVLQFCALLSQLILSSVRFQLAGEEDAGQPNKDRPAHLLVQNYFDLEGVPLKDFKLQYNPKSRDIEPQEAAEVSLKLA